MSLAVSAPGRICLFGEHQDYLDLPVIAAGIDLRATVRLRAKMPRQIRLDLLDLGHRLTFTNRGQRLPYRRRRDYFRAVYNILLEEGLRWPGGHHCDIRSRLPIQAGASSSSALVVAWLGFLLAAAGDARFEDREWVARLAYRAEVLEFREPGGMMDQFACALGGVILLDPVEVKARFLHPDLGAFVLGDSGEPKDTMRILSDVKQGALEAVKEMKKLDTSFRLRTTSREAARPLLDRLPQRQRELLDANLVDRDLLRRAEDLMRSPQLDHEQFGRLLTRHHHQLSRKKRVSTAKIDHMLEAALAAGALGGKINGSGGGGCMFAYAPHDPEKVMAAIAAAGGKPYLIHVDRGLARQPADE